MDATNSPQREAAEEYFRNLLSLFQEDDFLVFRTVPHIIGFQHAKLATNKYIEVDKDKLDANLK